MRLHLARSTRGFALIQVLVALAISFVVGAGLLSLTTNLFQVQQTAVQRNEAEDATRVISMYLSDTTFCTANLIQAPSGGTSLPVAQLTNGVNIGNLFTIDPATGGPLNLLYGAGSKNGFSSTLGINGMTLGLYKNSAAASNISATQMIGELRINYGANNMLPGGGLKTRTIPVLMVVTAGSAVSCQYYAASGGTIGVQSCLPGQFVRGVNSQGELDCTDFPISQCAPPNYALGIDSQGKVICSAAAPVSFRWVNRLTTGSTTVCSNRGGSHGNGPVCMNVPTYETPTQSCARLGKQPVNPAVDGKSACASGEMRAFNDASTADTSLINYSMGLWGGGFPGALGTVVGNFCYAPGQKQDGDPTDIAVAFLCRE